LASLQQLTALLHLESGEAATVTELARVEGVRRVVASIAR
jgi:hypothetical protein